MKKNDIEAEVAALFQQYVELDIEPMQQDLPEDPLEAQLSIVKMYYEQLYRKQKFKVPKARIEEILQGSRSKTIEKLLKDVQKLESKESPTLEEVFLTPITSDTLVERLQEFEQNELMTVKVHQLSQISNDQTKVTPAQFVRYFTFEDLQEAESLTKTPELKQALKSVISCHKRVGQILKRNQYLTEKLFAEVEKIIEGVPFTTSDIETFRSKRVSLQNIMTTPLDASKLDESIRVAQQMKFDSKLIASLKSKQGELDKSQQDFAAIRQVPINQEKLDTLEKAEENLKSKNLINKELFEMTNIYRHFANFVFKFQAIFFTPKYQLDDVIQQLLDNEIQTQQNLSMDHLQQRVTELRELEKVEVVHFQQSSDTVIVDLLKKFYQSMWGCQMELYQKGNQIDPQELIQFLDQKMGPIPEQVQALDEEARSFLSELNSLKETSLEVTLNQALDDMRDFRQLQRLVLKMIKQTKQSRLKLDATFLIQFYLQLVWTHKAKNLLDNQACLGTIQTLLSYANLLQIPDDVRLKRILNERKTLYETIHQSINEYVLQRSVWKKDREREVSNLKTIKQQLIYVNAKPSYDKVSQIAQDAKKLTFSNYSINTLLGDLEVAEALVEQFSSLDLPDNKEVLDPTKYASVSDIKHAMLYSFLKVEHLTPIVFYYLNKQSLLKAYNDAESLTIIQGKLDEFNIVVERETWLSNMVQHSEQDTSHLPHYVRKFIATESLQWIETIHSALQTDIQAHKLRERIPEGFAKVRELDSENKYDEERLSLRESHCVDFTELDDFIVAHLNKLKYHNDLNFLLQQHEGCRKILSVFEEMVNRLREFHLKFDLEKLEALIDQYLDGNIQVYLKEIGQLVRYAGMARTLWAEVLDQQDTMKQSLLDKKTHRQINDFLKNLVETQKKFNVEIPEVKRFAEEYFEAIRKVDEANQRKIDGIHPEKIRNDLNRDFPPLMKCLDAYQECLNELWFLICEEFLRSKCVWTQARLTNEIGEGYRLLEIEIAKSEEYPESFKLILEQLEVIYEEVELYVKLDDTDLNELWEDRISFSDRATIQLRKPFTDINDYIYRIKSKLQKQIKPQRKRDPKQLRIRPQRRVIPIQTKSKKIKKEVIAPTMTKPKKQSQEVSDYLRQESRQQLTQIIKQNPVFARESLDARVKAIESHLFGDFHDQKSRYEEELMSLKKFFKSIEPLKLFSRMIKRKEFDFNELKKYKEKINKLDKLEQSLAKKHGKVTPQGPKLLEVVKLSNKSPRKLQTMKADMLIQQRRLENIEQFPMLVPQQVRYEEPRKKLKIDSPILYNPDQNTSESYSDVTNIGALTIKLKPPEMIELNKKRRPVIKPLILTCDNVDQVSLFPENLLKDFQINQRASCPVSQVTDYLNQTKQTFKTVRGWLYTCNIEEAQELQRLAHQMKEQKVSIGLRTCENLIGISLVSIEHLSRSARTKWVIPTEVAEDADQLFNFSSYERLQLLKPLIGVYIYIKDFPTYSTKYQGGLKGQPFDYISLYKVPQLNRIIESHKDYQRSMRMHTPLPEFGNDYTALAPTPSYQDLYIHKAPYEPISDEEDIQISHENKLTALTVLNKGRDTQREREPQTPPESQLQSMIMREIPNILNLLKNDDNSD